MRHVEPLASGCWIWIGAKTLGYGKFGDGARTFWAHRWVYEQMIGTIPTGLQIDHLCRVPSCVNPTHLEPVTSRENMLRGESPAWRTYRTGICLRGHLLTPENTVWRLGGRWRQCRTCLKTWKREDYRRKKQSAISPST